METSLTVKDFYEQVPLGICVVSRDRRRTLDILYANQRFFELLRVDESIIGQPLDKAWPNPEAARLARKLKGPVPPQAWSLPVTSDGDPAPRWATLTISENSLDAEPCFVLWATDISRSKESEAKLRQAVQQADAVAEMKANFLATMSHEIRTPMQAIYGLLELVAEEKPDERITAMIAIAQQAASGLLEILDDVLDFAKIDADKMELDMFEVPVRTLANGIVEAMAVKARGKDISLEVEIGENVPFVIIGDPKRLRQILINLMSNAIKFTMRGAVTLRVTTRCRALHSAHGVDLRFEVVDHGIGISEEAASRLFMPFSQADNSTSRRFGGTGLGLSICKKLVNHMGGQIGVDSVPGEGSTFWFEIPTEEIGTEDSTARLPSLVGISILSVEDHPQGAREIKRSLESMGATVETCPTYREGLELIRRRPFDVGIIDQGLPDGLGLDLIREILERRPFMGLVMYTARDDVGLQHRLNSMGVKYLAKPAGRLSLGETVKDAARKMHHTGHDGPTRLLIAEDTASVRDVLQRQLDRLGVEADFVTDGREALEALKSGIYGILFTDLHMPEMDGYALAADIRGRETDGHTHLPIMVLTADVQMAQRHIYLEHGFDECLLKPVSLGQLRRLLIRWGLLAETPDEAEGETVAPPTLPEAARPAIDADAIRTQMGALDDDSIEMISMFMEMTAPLLDTLRQAEASRNYHALAEAAHSLKGGARSACCPMLGDLAAALQDDAGDGKDCGALVRAIDAEFERARQAVAGLKPD